MKYLLYGDDVSSSRNFLNGLTVGFQVTVLDGKNLTIPLLEENLVSNSLFEEKKAVVIEGLIGKNKKKKEFFEYLNTSKSSVLIILWEDKKLLKTSFTTLKSVTVNEFSLPQNYFQFLDSFTPGNAKRIFVSFHQLLNTMSEEQVFYSLLKRLRTLLLIESYAKTEETIKISPWQMGKLKQQLRIWPKEKLIKFYSELQDTEIKLKTGKLPVGLSKHLDILILSQLE